MPRKPSVSSVRYPTETLHVQIKALVLNTYVQLLLAFRSSVRSSALTVCPKLLLRIDICMCFHTFLCSLCGPIRIPHVSLRNANCIQLFHGQHIDMFGLSTQTVHPFMLGCAVLAVWPEVSEN